MLKNRASREFWLLALMALLVLGAGLGMRDPWPSDEPRFALVAKQMVESGDWLFPHRGTELYSDKPPMLMWSQATLYTLIGDWRVAYSLAMAGHGSFFEHDYRLAKARLTEALQIQREVGIRVGVASSLTTLAIIAHDEGDDDHAVIALREALTIVRDVGSPGHLCENLEAFAVVAGRIRSAEAAAHIWGAAERLREDARSSMIAVRRRWYDEQVAVTRAKSLDGVFEAAWNEGRAMTEEQVVAYALCVEAD